LHYAIDVQPDSLYFASNHLEVSAFLEALEVEIESLAAPVPVPGIVQLLVGKKFALFFTLQRYFLP
jgi:hypothetical protein